MRDVLNVVANGADRVSFHDLHVVGVVEQLHARGIPRFDSGDAEVGAIALEVQARDAIFDAVLIAHPAPRAE
jgi:hypothetical protein